MELGDLKKKDMVQDLNGNGNGIHFHGHLKSEGQVHGNGNHFNELQDHQVQDHEADQNQIHNVHVNQDQIQESENMSRERGSSGLRVKHVLIKLEYDEVQETNRQSISHSSYGNCFSLQIGESELKKSKTSRVLINVTAQLAGSLLAVQKQGLESTPRVEVLSLLYTSALSNAVGFLASLGGVWIQRKRPGAARTMNEVGCAFTVMGFMGMMGLFFL